jgi:hypothetical protein
MMTERFRKLGLLLIVLIAVGAPDLRAAQLSNVTVGRFQDFTVVTLFGDEKMTVTHQIVEAKEGKPHRIVIDLTGAEHGLPQNNFAQLPAGTITSIRTSQFAVSPDPVVRVVLDMAHPAAYRLETPGNSVRVMISLPGDPPLGKVWAATDAQAMPLAPEGNSPTLASANQPAVEVTDQAAAQVSDAPLAPKRAKTEPLPGANPAKFAKTEPLPGAHPAKIAEAEPKTESTSPAKQPMPESPAKRTLAVVDAPAARSKPLPEAPKAKGTASAPEAKRASTNSREPEVPLPMPAKRPDVVIDYNLPVPAAFAGAGAAAVSDAPKGSAQAVDNPAKATTRPPVLAAKEPALKSNPAKAEPTSQVTDQGSAPVASLTTLPPLKGPSPELVPQRSKVVYHTEGRRDPFLALLQSGGYDAAALPDVSNLRLVGLLHDVQESWGLFEDANGFGFILKKGDRVKNGRLTKIKNNRAYFNLTEFGWSRSVQVDLEPEG